MPTARIGAQMTQFWIECVCSSDYPCVCNSSDGNVKWETVQMNDCTDFPVTEDEPRRRTPHCAIAESGVKDCEQVVSSGVDRALWAAPWSRFARLPYMPSTASECPANIKTHQYMERNEHKTSKHAQREHNMYKYTYKYTTNILKGKSN